MKKTIDLARVSKDKIITRAFAVNSTVNEKDRSVLATLSTETPVRTYDWETGQVINEILLADGFTFPDQIPLLDCHQRYSVKDQLGSVREMKVEALALAGRVFFGETEDALAAFSLVKDRHLTDLSIGYVTEQVIIVKDGSEYKHTDGRIFKGPVKLSLKTAVKECSVTPIGADEMAKFRSAGVEDNKDLTLALAEIRDLKEKLNSSYKTISLLTL